jgi:hypothetical protein
MALLIVHRLHHAPMSNPYAPPSTRNDAPETLSNKDTILRRIGALSSAYLLASTLWRQFPDLQSMLIGAAVMALFIFGFLRGRRKFHFSISLFMALSIAVQTYFMNLAIAHPERLPMALGPRPWLEFAIAIIPHVIALTCASALYFRARATRA